MQHGKKYSWEFCTMLHTRCASALFSERQNIVLSTMCLVTIKILLRWQNTSIMLSIDMQFMLDEENFHSWHGAKAAWHHGRYVAKYARNRLLNALLPFLALFGAHILSFYEWKVVQQWLSDNSDVTCVSIGKSTWNIYVKKYNFCFQFCKVVQKH